MHLPGLRRIPQTRGCNNSAGGSGDSIVQNQEKTAAAGWKAFNIPVR